MTYQLKIKFRSNERPWETTNTPLKAHQPESKEAALKWAAYMQVHLSSMYDVTLVEDGKVIPMTEWEKYC